MTRSSLEAPATITEAPNGNWYSIDPDGTVLERTSPFDQASPASVSLDSEIEVAPVESEVVDDKEKK